MRWSPLSRVRATRAARRRERRRRWFGAAAVVCASHAFALSAGDGWPALPSPTGSHEFWIAMQAEQNGIPMQIRGFESAMALDEVLAFYRRWLTDKQAVTVQPRGDGWLLGATVASYRLTVQLEPRRPGRPGAPGPRVAAAAVTGTLTTARLPSEGTAVDWRAQAARDVPLPPGTMLVSSTVSEDDGRRNRTLIAVNRQSVEAGTLHLREHLLALGWRVVEERTVVPGQSSVLVMRTAPGAPAREAVLTVVRQDKGMVIVASVTDEARSAAP